MGVHTSTEIEELSLRTPHLVAIYLCESEATATKRLVGTEINHTLC
ncbi:MULTISPECIES: hypothetical protein [Lysinibacillus]|nr:MULTISPECIES: hypothetical protein [Lysinibacillus]